MNSASTSRKPVPVKRELRPRRRNAAPLPTRLKENFPAPSKACTNQRMAGESTRLADPLGRVEEVERVRGRRRVEHDEVVVDRRRARRGASPSPCTPASPRASRSGTRRPCSSTMRCGDLGARRVARHELVEGPLRVEHHRARASPFERRGPSSSKSATGTSLLLGRHLVEAQAVREAPRRVDRQAEDALALHRGMHRERGGGRGLAHPSAPHADHHAVLVQDLVEAHRTPVYQTEPWAPPVSWCRSAG